MKGGLPAPLVRAVAGARRLVVLTGAGMAAESGVPVFRGPGGLWEGARPEDLATPEAFAADPERVWRWYRWRLEKVASARPHTGYSALVDLERNGGWDRFTLVTQNVDGLHRRSGSRNVVELHGNLTRARCTVECGVETDSESVDPARPECSCGAGRLRPDVVWFGEALSSAVVASAFEAVSTADLVWVVGTSSLVYPAAALPAAALERGIPVVEVNPTATPLTARATHALPVSASEGLSALAAVRREAEPGASL